VFYLNIQSILEDPNDNGIVIFLLGILFILTVYHFLLYFQHKDKTYLYYSLYTFIIFLSHLTEAKEGFIYELTPPISDILNDFDINLIWTYNMLYFIFAFTFVDLKSYSLKWYHFIFRSIYFLFFVTILLEVLYRITGNLQFIYKGDLFFIISISLLGIIGYIPLFKIKSNLKYYIIIGSLILFITSLTATIIYKLKLTPVENEIRYSIFYIGVILENILFSLGLGHKQKIILREKNEVQKKLIKQLQENEKLKDLAQLKLEQDVVSLSKKAKDEKVEKLKANYDRQLAELKITALKSQMNPHFIFNSLNAIKLYIINNEKENAVYYLNKFSKLIRKILASTRQREISLSEEIETMELYVNIENIRFSNEIDFSLIIDNSANLDTVKIPPLILQPFLENAIWHGLSSKKGSKKLSLNVKMDKEKYMTITITDNGIGRKKSAQLNELKMRKKESIGIKLTEERLYNFAKNYKNDFSIEILDLKKNEKSTGTEVILKIPVK